MRSPGVAENKELVRRFYATVWSEGRLEAAGDFLADDLIDHDALAFAGRAPGAAGLAQVIAMIRAALPDLRRTIEQQIAEGDRVVTRFTDRGTHRGELLGIPATGRAVTVSGINIDLIRDGKIAEIWHVEDLLGLLGQFGAIPGGAGEAQPAAR
jgi:steroid delta-isomerase-like uncharacterized protein